MRSVRIALAVGLGITALALAATLSGSPTSVAATNGIAGEVDLVGTRERASVCQRGEVLPAGTSAIRLTLVAEIGPQISVTALSGSRVLAHGARGAGWTGASVTIPVDRVSHTTSGVKICFAVGPGVESLRILGEGTPRAIALFTPEGQRLPGRVGVEYLHQSHDSWLSLLTPAARRMGLGHAWSGTWIVFVLLAAMVSGATLASWLALQELR